MGGLDWSVFFLSSHTKHTERKCGREIERKREKAERKKTYTNTHRVPGKGNGQNRKEEKKTLTHRG